MELKFIGIGSNLELENSVGNTLIEAFESKNFNKVTIISAFSSLSAVKGIKHLASINKINDLTIITGIDQKGTSKEALEELLNSDAKAYVFYNPASIIFHPKLYLFRGEKMIQIIIGSSNLTSQGLFQNIEASISLKLDVDNDDLKPIHDLTENFKSLLELTDPNLKEISEPIIKELLELGIIPEEAERKKIYSKNHIKEKANRDKILQLFPKRKSATINEIFRKSSFSESISDIEERIISNDFLYNDNEETIVWEKILSDRDINMPSNPKTNPTGSMLFTKGINKKINQLEYFRHDVFSNLEWKKMENKENKESANASFQLIINGKDCGFFNLTVTHRTDSDSETFLQANSVTDLRWGKAINYIKNPELKGEKLQLLKKGDLFIIKIN